MPVKDAVKQMTAFLSPGAGHLQQESSSPDRNPNLHHDEWNIIADYCNNHTISKLQSVSSASRLAGERYLRVNPELIDDKKAQAWLRIQKDPKHFRSMRSLQKLVLNMEYEPLDATRSLSAQTIIDIISFLSNNPHVEMEQLEVNCSKNGRSPGVLQDIVQMESLTLRKLTVRGRHYMDKSLKNLSMTHSLPRLKEVCLYEVPSRFMEELARAAPNIRVAEIKVMTIEQQWSLNLNFLELKDCYFGIEAPLLASELSPNLNIYPGTLVLRGTWTELEQTLRWERGCGRLLSHLPGLQKLGVTSGKTKDPIGLIQRSFVLQGPGFSGEHLTHFSFDIQVDSETFSHAWKKVFPVSNMFPNLRYLSTLPYLLQLFNLRRMPCLKEVVLRPSLPVRPLIDSIDFTGIVESSSRNAGGHLIISFLVMKFPDRRIFEWNDEDRDDWELYCELAEELRDCYNASREENDARCAVKEISVKDVVGRCGDDLLLTMPVLAVENRDQYP